MNICGYLYFTLKYFIILVVYPYYFENQQIPLHI